MPITRQRTQLERIPPTPQRSPFALAARSPTSLVRSRPNVIERYENAPPSEPAVTADPYPDYRVELTPQAGILVTYKTFDDRLRHGLARITLWLITTGTATWLCLGAEPTINLAFRLGLLLAAAVLNWLVVSTRVEVYRSIEVRRDCIILDGEDVFFTHQMEGGWPTFQRRDDGSLVLCGIYGTRFVEFLTIWRFDENDRAPEVMEGHLQFAMQQLWARPWT